MSVDNFFLASFIYLLLLLLCMLLVRNYKFFLARRIKKTMLFLRNGPKTAREIVEFFNAREYLVYHALKHMINQGLATSHCVHEGGLQRPIMIFSLTDVSRCLLDSDDPVEAVLQHLDS